MTRPIIVSACLLGVRCNHRGEANESAAVTAFVAERRVVAVCPETMGGLPTPRPAAEISLIGRVIDVDGRDVTGPFERGASATLELAQAIGATEALLKARSPSCGCREVCDGTFSGRLVSGRGLTARLLEGNGVRVRSEEELDVAEERP